MVAEQTLLHQTLYDFWALTRSMAKNPQKSAFQITSPCYCWLWDCDKNKTKTCTFLTSQWVCIHKIVWNRLTLMNMCCDGKVPAFRENEAIKSKWTTNHKMFKDRTKIKTPIIFLFVLLNFFSPRNFDTFHLNKNRNHSRTSYKMIGQWNKKKKSSVCSFENLRCLHSQEVLSQW